MTMVRGTNPIWFEVDLTAHAFDDTFYLFVLENEIPYAPLTTWQDPFGNVEWTNPLRFLANGTLPNNLYFDPDTVYRLEFRQGPTQQDPLIYLVENYVPGTGGNTPIDEGSFPTTNMVSNPQFAVVNFTSPLTLTSISTQVINVAPDWFLNLTGSGSVTLTQVPLNATISDPTNASYALQIQLSGSWTNAYLSQRFNQNGILWANTFISSSIMALTGVVPETISSLIKDSVGNTVANLLNPTSLTETFNSYPSVTKLGPSFNTNFPPFAYIEYQLKLPNNCNITLSSIQLISSDVEIEYPYEQTTIERQIDQTFHYWNPQLKYKPIPSLLTAWDFTLSPFQFGGTGTITTTPAYIADQTIAACNTNTLPWARVTSASSLGVVSGIANQSWYLMQYLKGQYAFELTLSRLSTYINTYTGTNAGVICRIYLCYNNGGGTLPTLPSTIGTINADGTFTLTQSGWSFIPQNNGYANSFTIVGVDQINEQVFTGFNGLAFQGTTTSPNFAIVVTFFAPIVSTNVIVHSVGMMQGDIATTPAPQTLDKVLSECRYYYETSYSDLISFNSTPLLNLISLFQYTNGGSPVLPYATSGGFTYKTTKRIAPNLTFYSALKTSDNVSSILYWDNGSSVSSSGYVDTPITGLSSYFNVTSDVVSAYLVPNKTSLLPCASHTSASAFSNAALAFHFVADSRLGIV